MEFTFRSSFVLESAYPDYSRITLLHIKGFFRHKINLNINCFHGIVVTGLWTKKPRRNKFCQVSMKIKV